jgi:hypothetical protein
MNSRHCDKAFFALLEAEVREQAFQELERAQLPETVYRAGVKGPSLHYRGKGHQGYKLSLVSDRDKS